jgi:hypothetical protein
VARLTSPKHVASHELHRVVQTAAVTICEDPGGDDIFEDLMMGSTGNMPPVTAANWPGPIAKPGEQLVPFPTPRRVHRREIDQRTPLYIISDLFSSSGIQLGPLVPEHLMEEIQRTFWTYRDISAVELSDIPPTDLYEHRPRLAPGTKP